MFVSFLSHIWSDLKWATKFLLNFSLFPNYHELTSFSEDVSGLEHSNTDECAICLSKIDDDDEISDLRCNHVFHKFCLDRWIGSRRFTCPLCRSLLAAPAKMAGELEVLLFKYSGFSSPGERDQWWLR